MNNDPTSTPPAVPDANDSRHPRRHEDTSDHVEQAQNPGASESQQDGSTGDGKRQRQRPSLSKKAKEGLQKKYNLLLHLLQNLDTLIAVELCVLYYMDCSFFRFIIRSASQWFYLSPKSDTFFPLIPYYPLGAIVGPNVLCMLLHLATSLPSASEASRGYLHGGIFIDFVGQKPPASKLSLLFMDVLLLGLQCFMLTVNMEKDRVKRVIKPRQGTSEASTDSVEELLPTTGQDYDAEERGVLRDAPTTDTSEDIELQTLERSGDSAVRRAGQALHAFEHAVDQVHAHVVNRANRTYEDLSEVLVSGNAVLANFHVLNALQTAWNESGSTSTRSAALGLQNVGYNATLAALAARRRVRQAAQRAAAQSAGP